MTELLELLLADLLDAVLQEPPVDLLGDAHRHLGPQTAGLQAEPVPTPGERSGVPAGAAHHERAAQGPALVALDDLLAEGLQVLDHAGFEDVEIFPLNLYVFYSNPANWVAWAAAALLDVFFRAAFILYGKSNRIFTKKIGAVCRVPDVAG